MAVGGAGKEPSAPRAGLGGSGCSEGGAGGFGRDHLVMA